MKRMILALALIGGAAHAQERIQLDAAKVLSAPGGRYVFGQTSSARSDQFMLDTQTGRLWRLVAAEEGQNSQVRLLIVPYYTTATPDGTSPTPPR